VVLHLPLLFCHPLETTNASDVLNLVEDFLTADKLEQVWRCFAQMGNCYDRGAIRLLTLVKQKNPEEIGMHCINHWEALISNTMSPPLKQALDCGNKVVSCIKTSALNTRLFRKLCPDMDAKYDSLLFHTSVRWLSKRNMLIRLACLLLEIIEFVKIQHNKNWRLIFLTYCFETNWHS